MRRRLLLVLLGAVALPAGGLRAQSRELLRIDSLLNRSRLAEARIALDQWSARKTGSQKPDDVAFALLLQARLASRADSALSTYLELALGHPSSRYAPEALLRLGQGYAALAQHERAVGYLERIPRDYPTYPGRFLAVAWLARTQRAVGRPAAACTALRRVLGERQPDSLSRALVAAEQARCDSPPPAAAAQPSPAPPRTESGPMASARGGEGRYTVQIAAFRQRDDAVALVRKLRNEDIPARVVILAGGTLSLVRAGRFPTSADAAPLLRRVRALVPAAHVAADAHREDGASR